MFGNLGIMMLLHNPLLKLWIVRDIEEVLVINESILEFPFCTLDCVSLGVLKCLDHDYNWVLLGLLSILSLDLFQNILLCPFKGHPFECSDCEQLQFQ
jgi:hypothetical protein